MYKGRKLTVCMICNVSLPMQCKRIQGFMPEFEKLRNEIASAASCRAQEDTFQSPREKNVKSRMKLEERCGVMNTIFFSL